MTNIDSKIKVPKRLRELFNNDIGFNIENYVLNKDIVEIPKKGYLIQKAIKIRKLVFCLLGVFVVTGFLFIFGYVPFKAVVLIENTNSNIEINSLNILGISSLIIFIIGWIIWFIDVFIIGFYYTGHKIIEPVIQYFNKLVEQHKLVNDLKKYPVIFNMTFYYNKISQFAIDFPKTYPLYSPFYAMIGLGIFFDKLDDYINPTNN